MMVFVSISGYKSIGNLISEKRPKIITAAKQRLVIIGRLTAPSYRLIDSFTILSFTIYHFYNLTLLTMNLLAAWQIVNCQLSNGKLFHYFHFLAIRQATLTCNYHVVTWIYATDHLILLADVLTQFHFVVGNLSALIYI